MIIAKLIGTDSHRIPMFQIIEETSFEIELSFNQENNFSNNFHLITLHQNCISKTADVRKVSEKYRYLLEMENKLNKLSASLGESILYQVWEKLTLEDLVSKMWGNEYLSILDDNIKIVITEEVLNSFSIGKLSSVSCLKDLRANKYIKMLPEHTQQDLDVLNCIICDKLYIMLSPLKECDENICLYLFVNHTTAGKIELSLCKERNRFEYEFEKVSEKEIYPKVFKSHLNLLVIGSNGNNFGKISQEMVHINELRSELSELQSVKLEESVSSTYSMERLSLLDIQENIFHFMTSLDVVVNSEVKKQYLLNGKFTNYKILWKGILYLLSMGLSINEYGLYVLHKDLK